ncbi:hypothetical protein CYMTET_24700, partial [Cymbomonas tetramitiformis]
MTDPKSCLLLSVPEKKSAQAVDIIKPISSYIGENFSEHETEAQDDLETVQDLRTHVVSSPQGLENRRDYLIKYFRALCAMELRFPISKEKEHIHTISFAWYDAFKTGKKTSQHNIHFEKAAILFNLAAVQSQQGVAANRGDPDGLKAALKAFQEAAGSLELLRDVLGMKVGPGATTDISVECTNVLINVLLAQAQECVHEKCLAEDKNPAIVAKVGKQVSIFYENANANVQSSALTSYFDKAWQSHLSLKATHFKADAFYRSSLVSKAEEQIGPQIARLRQASALLSGAKRGARGSLNSPAVQAMNGLEGVVTAALTKATKDNEVVFMELVPQPDTLPVLTGHPLVKPIPPGDILNMTGEDLFARIVPDTGTKALSKYTDMVDCLIR